MSLTLITVGMIFLCNPMIAIFDIAPDFIGYALILFGLNRISAISPELDDARPYFRYLLIASVARSFVFFASGTFDETMNLSVTLVFAAIEFGLALMAFPALYEGLSYLNIRYSGKAKECPEFKTISAAFFCIRGIMSLIPMLGSVMYNPDDELITSPDQVASGGWGEYALILNAVNVVITLIFAAFWLAIAASYIGKLSKDPTFKSCLTEAYKERCKNDPAYFARRTLCFAFSAAAFGSFFLIDLLGDGLNYIPDFIFGAFMLAVLYLIRKYSDKLALKKALISGGVFTALSIANFVEYTLFMKRRFYAPFEKLMMMFPEEYVIAVIFALLECISLIVFAYYLFYAFMPVLQNETTPDVPENFIKSVSKNKQFVKRSIGLLYAFCISLGTTAVSTLLFSALLHVFPKFWMINFALNVIFFCIANVLFSKIITGVKNRYSNPNDKD